MQNNYQNNINLALKELSTTRSISSALLVCKTLLEYMGIETKSVEDIELSKLKLPNAERYDRWFDAHPHFRGDRACFDLTPKEENLEVKFFALQKKTKLFIAGSVNFTPNFEDRDYTRNDPNMKVGIDFFFTPEKDSVIVVLSNKGSLRLVELSGRLTNTQNDIFSLWHNVGQISDRNILHTTIWESFKLSSLNKKFYEGIANSFLSLTQHLQKHGVDEQLSNQFANRLHGRLLFLWFLRKKNIINESKEYFNIDNQSDTDYYRGKLAYLFFDVLNTDISDREKVQKEKDTLFGKEKEEPSLFVLDSKTPYLNGGLFDQNADGEYWNKNKPTFPTGFFRALYDHFDSFNFTTDESTPEYEQIAIDPEMLGRIFESFLATLTTETGAQAKKANGAFYTPREIVSYMSRESLRQYLYTALDAGITLKTSIDDLLDRPDSEWALAGTNSKRDTVAKQDRERIMDALRKVKVLDPAVGSGAFPMGVLHKILSLFERLEPNFDSYETKLSILQNNIYGVDIDPTAIEISRLRAWLSIIVDVKDTKKIKPLPNLDFKFVCANSLIGLEKSQASFTTDENLKPELIRIRDEYYATSSKVKKEKLQKEYLKLTHSHQNSLLDTEDTRQLKSYEPFKNGITASFYDSELMHGVEAFDVVIGNPPYVGEKGNKKTFEPLKNSYIGERFYFGKMDLFYFFFHLGLDLLKDRGVMAFITTNYYVTATGAVKLRNDFKKRADIIKLINFGELKIFESALGQHNMITMLMKGKDDKKAQTMVTNRKGYLGQDVVKTIIDEKDEQTNYYSLLQDDLYSGNNIKLTSGGLDDILNKIKETCTNLGDVADVNVGLYTGADKVSQNYIDKYNLKGINIGDGIFLINKEEYTELKLNKKETELCVPMFKNSDIARYTTKQDNDKYLIDFSYPNYIDYPINSYPNIIEHLLKYKTILENRQSNDNGLRSVVKKGYWWLFTKRKLDFNQEKIIAPQRSKTNTFGYNNTPWYASADVYFITNPKEGYTLKYLLGVLNSYIIFVWLYNRGKRKGEMLELYQQPLSCIPIPRITTRNKHLANEVEKLVDKIIVAKKFDPKIDTKGLEDQINTLVYHLYGLTEDEIKTIENS